MSEKPSPSRNPQAILILRVVGGAYLLYLAWDLRTAALGENGLPFLIAVVVFALAGAALLLTSVRLLRKGEFLRPWETPGQEAGGDEDFDEDLYEDLDEDLDEDFGDGLDDDLEESDPSDDSL